MQDELKERRFPNVIPDEPGFRQKLAGLLNSVSRENRSNTPDFILAAFLETCLFAFENANNSRERWYGKYLNIAGRVTDQPDYEVKGAIPVPEMNDVNLQSPEGNLFNAAMAILTTECFPEIEFGLTFKKVAALAKGISDGNDVHRSEAGEAEAIEMPKFKNAGNRNEIQP